LRACGHRADANKENAEQIIVCSDDRREQSNHYANDGAQNGAD